MEKPLNLAVDCRWRIDLGLRLLGAMLVGLSALTGHLLDHVIQHDGAAGPQPLEYLLAALSFGSASGGALLLCGGSLLLAKQQAAASRIRRS